MLHREKSQAEEKIELELACALHLQDLKACGWRFIDGDRVDSREGYDGGFKDRAPAPHPLKAKTYYYEYFSKRAYIPVSLPVLRFMAA